MSTTELKPEVGIIPREPYVAGVNVVARRFDALVQSRRVGEIEIISQAQRVPIGEDDIRALAEDAMYYAHRTKPDSDKVEGLVVKYLYGNPDAHIEPMVGETAPCTIANLNAIAIMAILDTDPDQDRASRMRREFEEIEASGQDSPLRVEKEDTLLTRVKPSLLEAFMHVLPKTFTPPEDMTKKEQLQLAEEFEMDRDAELCALTMYGLSRGLLRTELRQIREEAKRTLASK